MIRQAASDGKQICVHGDYDVDGICATALEVLVLRELGAEVDWHLPSRFDEGYGVARQTLDRLAGEGYGLVLTVDWDHAPSTRSPRPGALGLQVIVTDHHRPAERIPDCPIVATRPSSYPFPELCGTGVAFKLAQALLGADSRCCGATSTSSGSRRSPTSSLSSARTARSRSPACVRSHHAPSRAARADARGARRPATVDERAVSFRLAPRLPRAASGIPGAALELLLTDDARPGLARRRAGGAEPRAAGDRG